MKALAVISAALAAMFGAVVLVLLLSLFSTFLWYCFDDALAELVGVSGLGHLHWYHVWAATMFVASLFKSQSSSSS